MLSKKNGEFLILHYNYFLIINLELKESNSANLVRLEYFKSIYLIFFKSL
jgi:hypothetical protein